MHSGVRVLIVDDHPDVRASLAAFLEDGDFVVRSTASGTEAMSILENEPIDVAIVDLRLGEIDGQNLIQRAGVLYPGLRFLIYTGSLGFKLTQALQDLGVEQADVLYKPVKSMKTVADAILRIARKEKRDVQRAAHLDR